MALEIKPWDAAEFLKDAEDIFYFLEASLEDSSAEFIAKALATCGRAIGSVPKLADMAHVSVSALQSAIANPGDSSFDMARTIMTNLQPSLPSSLVA